MSQRLAKDSNSTFAQSAWDSVRIGRAFSRPRYSVICCASILLRLLWETKILFAISNAQISGTTASLTINSFKMLRLYGVSSVGSPGKHHEIAMEASSTNSAIRSGALHAARRAKRVRLNSSDAFRQTPAFCEQLPLDLLIPEKPAGPL